MVTIAHAVAADAGIARPLLAFFVDEHGGNGGLPERMMCSGNGVVPSSMHTTPSRRAERRMWRSKVLSGATIQQRPHEADVRVRGT